MLFQRLLHLLAVGRRLHVARHQDVDQRHQRLRLRRVERQQDAGESVSHESSPSAKRTSQAANRLRLKLTMNRYVLHTHTFIYTNPELPPVATSSLLSQAKTLFTALPTAIQSGPDGNRGSFPSTLVDTWRPSCSFQKARRGPLFCIRPREMNSAPSSQFEGSGPSASTAAVNWSCCSALSRGLNVNISDKAT